MSYKTLSYTTQTVASLLLMSCVMVTSSEAQLVRKLGNLPWVGKVKQTSFLGGDCDSCAASPTCGAAGCDDPSCGCEAPSCGLAGSILGSCLGAGPGGCGATIEPSCGSSGLGYAGGFGLCGGSCNNCGDGGYLGRNLQRVSPCACGGSLVGDMARGLLSLVDRAVGATVTTVFGGLQKVTCHASGTFAALECAAAASCTSCGMVDCGCGAAPSCGIADADCGCAAIATCDGPACGMPATLAAPNTYQASPMPSYPAPTMAPAAPMDGGFSEPRVPAPAIQPSPTPAIPAAGDPFLDDIAPTPQARVLRMPNAPGYRVYGNGNAGRASTITPASHASRGNGRYLRSTERPITLRR